MLMKAVACVVLFISVMSCSSQTQKQRAFDVFNEGVAFSLAAMNETDTAKAFGLERRAIAKYEQTLAIDSTHRMVRATMGHSYYLLENYEQAIKWFEASNKVDTASVPVYRELGVCKIALNRLGEGWDDLQTAFRLDSISKTGNPAETKKITADDLYSMGCRAFEYGETYEAQGDTEKGIGFKEYGLNILFIAYDIELSRKDIAKAIAERTGKLGDVARQNKYLKLSK
jgi:tetratricopeptide (TPR) repeat protein